MEATKDQCLAFAAALAAEVTLRNVKAVAAERVSALLDAEGATVFVWDATANTLVFDAVSGPAGATLQGHGLPIGQGIAGQVAADRRSVLWSVGHGGLNIDPSFDHRSGFATASVIAVPMCRGGALVGVLEAVRGPGRRPFGAPDLALLEELATFVGSAVEHARLHALEQEANVQTQRDNAELERRVAERTAQIARAKQEWERTFDAIRDPIALQDGFVLRRVNIEYARRAGKRVQEIIGRKCHEVLAGRSEPCPGCPLLVDGAPLAELSVRNARLQVSAYPMSFGGQEWSAVLSYRDVTGQRALERQLVESERLASIGQLASGAAHEINNPLAFLMSNVATMRQDVAEASELLAKAGATGIAAEWQEMLDDTHDGARRIADIVKHLQMLAGPGPVAREPARVDELVRRAVRAVVGDSHQVNLLLRSDVNLETAPSRLLQAFEHVLRNAKQAVDRDAQITVTTADEEDDVVVCVADRGVGMPADVLAHVFEPFFTTRGVGKGAGLGLTATWGIVQQLGGRVTISSTPGEGTTVELRLPRVGRVVAAGVVKQGRYASRSDPA